MSINDRIIILIGLLEGGKRRAFARKTGIPEGTLSSIVGTRRSDVSYAVLTRIVEAYPDINLDWLIKSEGEPFSEKKSGFLPGTGWKAEEGIPGKPDFHQYLPSNLKLLRTYNHLSQVAFAELFHTSRDVIAGCERGSEPRLSFLIRVSNYFRIRIDDLLSYDLRHHLDLLSNIRIKPR